MNGMEFPTYTRRLSDKILWAFDHAVEQGAIEAAHHLMLALELALTSEGGPDKIDKRRDFEAVVAAYNKLKGIG